MSLPPPWDFWSLNSLQSLQKAAVVFSSNDSVALGGRFSLLQTRPLEVEAEVHQRFFSVLLSEQRDRALPSHPVC